MDGKFNTSIHNNKGVIFIWKTNPVINDQLTYKYTDPKGNNLSTKFGDILI
jgi:hypothetical protein